MKKLLDIYRFTVGFLVIQISGGFPERFLNLCNREKIYLWDSSSKNGCITAKIRCKDFFRLNTIRRKSGVHVQIIEKCGIVFRFRENKKRKILIYGLIFSIIIMNLLNLFVWCIEVTETQNISKNEILETGKISGLDFGTFTLLYDGNQANREFVNFFNGKAVWSAVNIKGSKASFDVREYTQSEAEESDEQNPCNVIADFDGVIISVQPYSGTPTVYGGSAVKEGDLLVSGISENSDGTVSYHNADGKITALRKCNLSKHGDRNGNVGFLDETISYTELIFFTLKIPIQIDAFKKTTNDLKYTEFLKIDKCILPFGYTTASVNPEKQIKSVNYDPIYNIDEFTAEEFSMLKNSLIINSDYSISATNEAYDITAEYDCIDFIGKKSLIFQEN